MKMSSKEANKLLKKLNEDYQALLENEKSSCTFIASIQENVEDCRPQYDYVKTQNELNELQEKIRKVKHAINIFNSTTMIEELNMTIDQVLVYMPQLSKQKEKYMAMKSLLHRKRCTDDYGRVERIDYRYANYDIENAKKDYDKTTELLNKAQMCLDRANSMGKIEIDI